MRGLKDQAHGGDMCLTGWALPRAPRLFLPKTAAGPGLSPSQRPFPALNTATVIVSKAV